VLFHSSLRPAATSIEFVPTAQERTGNFSDISTIIHDPTTNVHYPGNQIPTSLLSAPAQYFLQHMPLPNGPNGQVSFLGPSAVQTDQQYMPKIDYITGKHHLSGRYFYTRYQQPPDFALFNQNIRTGRLDFRGGKK
jgi:hypothetical protein